VSKWSLVVRSVNNGLLLVAVTLLILASMLGRAAPATEDLKTDPTAPLFPTAVKADAAGAAASAAEAAQHWELQSILIRGDDRIAVINAQRVRVGATLGFATVARIDSDRVTLNVNGARNVLVLYSSSVKTPNVGKTRGE
jgi:hypothetical protein